MAALGGAVRVRGGGVADFGVCYAERGRDSFAGRAVALRWTIPAGAAFYFSIGGAVGAAGAGSVCVGGVSAGGFQLSFAAKQQLIRPA